MTKELTAEEREKYAPLFKWVEEDRDAAVIASLVLLSRLDTPNGFAAFYELIMGMQPPAHVMEWIRAIYKAHEEDKGIIIEAFRGSTKTTVINIFNAFMLGHRPTKNIMLIQAGNESAWDNTAFITGLIENRDEWKLVFPHIEPDRVKGWGAGGYEIKRTDIEYAQFRKECDSPDGKGKDPHLIGVGYESKSIIGKHPNNVLVVDDIHDESNTSSPRELKTVLKTLKGTIFPTMIAGAVRIIVGTPWVEGDALDYCKSTGEFMYIKTPVMKKALEEDPNSVYFSKEELGDFSGWYTLTWPEEFTKEVIISWFNLVGSREFARMYILDLDVADVEGLKYYSCEHSRIDTSWQSGGGCDYASVMEERRLEQKDRSYFAHLWGFKDPYNRIIVYDGTVEQCTQMSAEQHLWKPQNIFENWKHTEFEADGKGEEAYTVFARNPGLKINPFKVQRIPKTRRHELQVAPWLENGRVMISDVDTPAMNRLRTALRKWPNGNLDVIDALYALLRVFPECLIGPDISGELPSAKKKKRTTNPYKELCAASWR